MRGTRDDDAGAHTSGLPRSVIVLTALLAAIGAVTATVAALIGEPAASLPATALVALLGALVLAGSLQIKFSHRDHLETLDLFDAVLAAAIFSLAGPQVVLLAAAGKAVSQAFLRVRPTKALFNVAQWMGAAGMGTLSFNLLRSGQNTSLRNVAALAVAMAVTSAANHLAVVGVLSLVSPDPFHRVIDGLFPVLRVVSVVIGAANVPFGVLLVATLQDSAWAAALFLVPLVMLYWAYRGFAEGRADRTRLAGLQRATHALARPVDPREAIGDFLREVRACFEAEVAEVVLVTDGGFRVHRACADDPSGTRTRFHRSGSETLAITLLQQGRSVRVGPTSTGVVADLRSREGWRDCIAVPVGSGGDLRGVLCTYNRTGLEGFEKGEIAVLEALAAELSGALEKALLVQEMFHQATHDALTGLPNRTLFHDRLCEAISSTTVDARVGVMLVDLDRFKEINDTLGHHNGDLLLQEISGRLQNALRPSDTIARLGGDEFAVVLPDVAGGTAAGMVAERVQRAFDEPFVIDELTLDVDASIGIALYPDDGEKPATLLQRADVAMYAAKGAHAGYQLYSTTNDPYSPRRLALGRELRCAVADGQLAVYYQPKTDLLSGRITGVEALLRWDHPTHGFVPPDEFIPLAERTGGMRALTLFVLREALEQSQSWRRQGLDLDMAVNLSVRSLLDNDLPTDVAGLLQASGAAAESLTLEITETSVMADSGRSLTVLSRLHDLGVGLSIDDFGTGQSSLSYLKRLPVDEIKIDRSFITNMATDENDTVIVRSTIDLGHNLGLRVVAEGVEDAASWSQLVELGCDVAQGFFCSRPLPAGEVGTLITARNQGHAARNHTHGVDLVRMSPLTVA